MNRDGNPMPFPVLLIRFVKAGDSAPAKCAANKTPTNKQRFPAEVVTATIPAADGVVSETLFLSTITRDVRDAVDAVVITVQNSVFYNPFQQRMEW